jgi:hypothetical protein
MNARVNRTRDPAKTTTRPEFGRRSESDYSLMQDISHPTQHQTMTHAIFLQLPFSPTVAKHAMPLPTIFTRPSSHTRYSRLSPPASPRVVASHPQIGNPEIGNLEDAVGALERWWATSDRGKGGEKQGGRWRVWFARAPLIGKYSHLRLLRLADVLL